MTTAPTDVSLIQEPPSTAWGILQRLGPGLIIAGSIVGSGELIGTTSTGATAGFVLLWLIVIGCVIKVWVQVELGRYTMVSGQTTMQAMNAMPGPAIPVAGGRMNWLAMYWLVMFLVSLGQLGGIVAGVGQSMAIACPLTSVGREYNQLLDEKAKLTLKIHQLQSKGADDTQSGIAAASVRIQEISLRVFGDKATGEPGLASQYRDEKYWAGLFTIATSIILVVGRYKLIEVFTTLLVAGFTFLSVVTVVMLQLQGEYAVSATEFLSGFAFRLPETPTTPGKFESPLIIALSTLGIIGVGANELIQYPYWCQEKGYARFTGTFEDSPSWIARARGWLNVLHWDAWCSMVVYTFATIAFYLLGAAVLGRLHLIPHKDEMIRTLAVMYEPIFGTWTAMVFLLGAFAVLYSTFLVANAGHARVCGDAVRVFCDASLSDRQVRLWINGFNALFPFVCFVIYLWIPNPPLLVFASGAMQTIMLPMLAVTAIYFRYTKIDARIAPGKFWDVCLWLSALFMLFAGIALVWIKALEYFPMK